MKFKTSGAAIFKMAEGGELVPHPLGNLLIGVDIASEGDRADLSSLTIMQQENGILYVRHSVTGVFQEAEITADFMKQLNKEWREYKENEAVQNMWENDRQDCRN